MATLTFSSPDTAVIDMYQSQFTGSAEDSVGLKTAYPNFLKVLKFNFPPLHKSVMFLGRYLVSSINDTAKLNSLSTNLEVYLAGKGGTSDSMTAWKEAHRVIQNLLDDSTMFNPEITRDGGIDTKLYTDNLNTDDEKFGTIIAVEEIDDGSKSIFVV
jgi:hypothetical protein